MEKVNIMFGSLKVKKMGTFNIEAKNQAMDIFVTKVINGTTDHIGLIAMAPHQGGDRDEVQLSQLNWEDLHVRSYLDRSELENAFKKLTEGKLGQLLSQRIKNPKWSNADDIVLSVSGTHGSKKEYQSKSNIPFKVILHNASDIDRQVELIPALQTFDFTLIRK
tara:strand:+ start:861 stop:1352 length:492 start_codon:yes stop_codon:yes gene_type:complete